MAKEILPVDFKDDIMSESMEGRRRYRMIQNPDGTVSFEDTTEYDQIGSLFGQGQINKTNQAVNESLDKSRVIDNINDIASNSETGYVMGALAGKELNQNLALRCGYINTARKLATVCNSSGVKTTYTYTAPEACCVTGTARLWSENSCAVIKLDNVEIFRVGGGDTLYGEYFPITVFLREGQSFSIYFSSVNNGTNDINAFALL